MRTIKDTIGKNIEFCFYQLSPKLAPYSEDRADCYRCKGDINCPVYKRFEAPEIFKAFIADRQSTKNERR